MYSEFNPSQPFLPFLDLYLARRSFLELVFASPKHTNPPDNVAPVQELTVGDDGISDCDSTTQEKVEEGDVLQPRWTLGLSPPRSPPHQQGNYYGDC